VLSFAEYKKIVKSYQEKIIFISIQNNLFIDVNFHTNSEIFSHERRKTELTKQAGAAGKSTIESSQQLEIHQPLAISPKKYLNNKIRSSEKQEETHGR
jgi:putative ubiquitin-RnfH superfamily antitoxin RatB of RatAB toxin-antitoxin module